MNKLIVLIAAVLLLSACAIPPKPFVDGAEVAPPLGCLDARTRGVNC